MGLAALLFLTAASVGLPDPCRGPSPAPGAVIEGVVLHVIDARRLCVAAGRTPDKWTELELASDAPWPTLSAGAELSKAALMNVAFSRRVSCLVVSRGEVAPMARCRIEGASIESLLARPGALEAAAAWLPRPKTGPPRVEAAAQ